MGGGPAAPPEGSRGLPAAPHTQVHGGVPLASAVGAVPVPPPQAHGHPNPTVMLSVVPCPLATVCPWGHWQMPPMGICMALPLSPALLIDYHDGGGRCRRGPLAGTPSLLTALLLGS